MRPAHKRTPTTLCFQRPGPTRIRAFLFSDSNPSLALRRERAIDGSRRSRRADRSLTIWRETAPVLAGAQSRNSAEAVALACGCSRYAVAFTTPGLRSTSDVPMHSASIDPGGAARDVRDARADHVQRATASDGMLARGHSRSGNTSRSSRRPRTPGFHSGNAGSNPARDATTCLVNSAARVPACLAGSRGFESRTRRQLSSR